MVHCQVCGAVPVPDSDLPVMLPDDAEFLPTGESPLRHHEGFLHTKCPKCGEEATRETDTMDTFMCSSWYQNRYVDAKNENAPWDKEAAKTWLPVDLYIGGVEHACGHLMYFRFITKVLFDQGWLPVEEPVVRLFNHGMVKDKTGQIMSKSIGNVISPKEVMEKWGVDVCRLAMFFFAPSGDEIKWDPQGLAGANRFMTRLWKFMSETLPKVKDVSGKPEKPEGSFRKIRRKTHQLIRKTTDAAEGDLAFNTVISTMMELLNLIDQEKAEPKTEDDLRVLRETADALARTIAPLAPFVAEEFWEGLGGKKSVFQSGWPVFDAEALKLDELQIVVQVNGKVRGKVTVPASASDEDVRTAALSEEKIQSALSG
ncbi:MAG: class I tRNA ligase family protein, partial [Planctomycetota bacterium]|nr:class I tRNA ligase family protein [Planctomycetota bacterium]